MKRIATSSFVVDDLAFDDVARDRIGGLLIGDDDDVDACTFVDLVDECRAPADVQPYVDVGM